MPTQQFPINAGPVAGTFAPAATNSNYRNSLYIRNYANSTASMWVAFGQVATPGANGEMEIVPGSEYAFGGPLVPNNTTPMKGYPIEYVSVVTTGYQIATITVANDHTATLTLVNPTSAISVGDTIVIAGNSMSPYNGTWTVLAVSSSTVITFTASSNVTPEGFGGALAEASSVASGCIVTT